MAARGDRETERLAVTCAAEANLEDPPGGSPAPDAAPEPPAALDVAPPTPPAPPAYPPPAYAPPTYSPYYPPLQVAPAARPIRLWRLIGIAAAVLLIVVALGAYGAYGVLTANGRLSTADNAINLVMTHQDDFDSAVPLLAKQLGAVNSSSAEAEFANQAAAFQQSWQQNRDTVRSDTARLASAERDIGSQRWLTWPSGGSLDAESRRLDHARKAEAAALFIANGYFQDGQFLTSFGAVATDDTKFVAAYNAKQYVDAVGELKQLETDMLQAIALSSAPGLPASLHQFLLDVQKLNLDLIAVYNAYLIGDTAAYDKASAAVDADQPAVITYDASTAASAVTDFYRPYLDTYHSELTLATA